MKKNSDNKKLMFNEVEITNVDFSLNVKTDPFPKLGPESNPAIKSTHFKNDRRDSEREKITDRRHYLRPTKSLLLKGIFAAALILVALLAAYLAFN